MDTLADYSHEPGSQVLVASSGQVTWAHGHRWVSYCAVDMHFFPFDTQVSCEGTFTLNAVNIKFNTTQDSDGEMKNIPKSRS